jgi:hypothetical protein
MAESTAGLILQAARVLFRPGDVVELRVPKAAAKGRSPVTSMTSKLWRRPRHNSKRASFRASTGH